MGADQVELKLPADILKTDGSKAKDQLEIFGWDLHVGESAKSGGYAVDNLES